LSDNNDKEDGYNPTINATYELNKSKFANDLIYSHRFVREYYDEFNNNREVNHNFVRGFHYDGDEVRKYRDKRKTPIVFNQIKTSERTILGLMLQNNYEAEFQATSPADDDISEILQQLDARTAEDQGDSMNDIELMRQAWAGGNSFQECWMEVKNGSEPTMYTTQQNPFAIYWDPESRILITREDAHFVDRDSWITYTELQKQFPDKKKLINEHLQSTTTNDGSYDEIQVFADRSHEYKKEKNSEFLLTERFYKVDGVGHFAMMGEQKVEIDEEDLKEFKRDNPDIKIQKEDVEELWIAIVCEEYSNNDYLYNGKYHNQPRDPRTHKIIWPILEMVAESLAGEPQGFVDHERGPNKVVNAMMSNIVSSATHASAAAMLIDKTAFVSEREAKLAARHHSDSDRSFNVKQGRVGDAMAPVPRAGVNADHQYALDYSLNFLKEVTSTPPSLQGIQEESGVSGVLNAQRIEQGFVQLQPLMKNYRLFLKQRDKLRYYYWRTYYTKEMTFRVVDKTEPNMNPFVTVNQLVPEQDALGNFTGGYKKLNDLNTAIYDIVIKESVKSATYRDKQLRIMGDLLQLPQSQSDPGLSAAIMEEILRLGDAPEKTKEFVKKYSNMIQNAEATKRQAEQQLAAGQQEGQELDNMSKMQGIAETEATQTGANVSAVPPAGPPQGTPQPNMSQVAQLT